ncbi:hypothetical protein [Salimicrobium flavidum]|uniref:Uncharacterized protein n=1 Tax=Salimicrobium flavidum TaxID=570947 RepID=A0A1N7IYW7_9BACI|nr:hypothetical protein [Salimicrobium flavidum]SIS42244.1 hypothetical protein SAMN05421687_1033 [Salimicrobium flavidum]
MRKTLTDEHLDKLAKAFIYHTYGEPEPKDIPEPRLSFECYVEAWKNGEDYTADLRIIQQHEPVTERTKKKTVQFPSRSASIVRKPAVPAVQEVVEEQEPMRPSTPVAFHS